MSDGTPSVRALLPHPLKAQVAAALQRAAEQRVQERVRAGDATLWGPEGAPEIASRLGWLTIAERMQAGIGDLRRFAGQVASDGIDDVVLLGMGGSSLAPEVIRRAFGREGAGHPAGFARLRVLDSTNAGAVRAVDASIDAQRTLFLVSSKSGGTIEPLSMFAHFWEKAPDGARFAAITDPRSGLEQLASQRGFRRIFHGDPHIGGRYSALSPFGIVPAALIGADLEMLLSGAERAWSTPIDAAAAGADGDPAWLWLGVALAALAQGGRDKLTFIVPHSLDGLGLWLEQLFAESTGKRGTGILPVAEEPLCDVGDYGEDRVFVWITDEAGGTDETGRPASAGASQDAGSRADHRTAMQALAAAGHPVMEIPSSGTSELGRIFMLAELCVAVAGWGLSINPFDQPNVQEAKDATNEVLAGMEQGRRPAPEPDATAQELQRLLGGAQPPSYIALMGYVQPSAAFDSAVAELRRTLICATHATTTFGYGPRFLHSTGQFHKGGPPSGRFLQLLHDSEPDVQIPGRPYTFTSLHHAQADGDLRTLRNHRLPAARVTLKGRDPAAALRELTQRIADAALRPLTR